MEHQTKHKHRFECMSVFFENMFCLYIYIYVYSWKCIFVLLTCFVLSAIFKNDSMGVNVIFYRYEHIQTYNFGQIQKGIPLPPKKTQTTNEKHI